MLTQTVETYLSVRRAVGFKLTSLERYLRNFACFAANRGDQHIVAQTAIHWAGQTDSPEQCALRLQMVIRLARFSRMDDPRHEIPPAGVFPRRHRRPTPYIFSPQELQALFAQAAGLGPPGSLRPYTYRTLLPLLAVTGLRISEAIALRLSDHVSGGLVVRETKFRKSRMVPLHPTGHAALQHYVDKRRDFARGDEDHIFISGRHHALCAHVVRETFYQLLAEAGITRTNGRARPRLMDLRHTYATTILAAGPDNRDEVCRHTIALSTAMGHSCIAATFWYLERTPALMNDIADACQDRMARRQP
ncbi:MAG: tyrosine-type recombinase/integrase [Gammaproteobacteria bacterium]